MVMENKPTKRKGSAIRRFIMYGVDYLRLGGYSMREDCYHALRHRDNRKPIELAEQYGLPTNGKFRYKDNYLFGDWNGEKEHIAGKIETWLHSAAYGNGQIPAGVVERWGKDLAFLRGVVTQGEYDRFRNERLNKTPGKGQLRITDIRALMSWLLTSRDLLNAEQEKEIRAKMSPGMGVTQAIGLFPQEYRGVLMARYRADKQVEQGKVDDMKSLVKTISKHVSVFDEEPETINTEAFLE
jgi:hypothetical protein